MTCRPALVLAVAVAAVLQLSAQATPYGSSTPPGWGAAFDSGGQLPFIGSTTFHLQLHGHSNAFGGALLLGFAPTLIPIGAATVLVDPNGILIVDMPPGLTTVPLGVPNAPGLVGYSGYTQFGVFDPALLGGFGLTNGLQVTVMPDKTPTRAHIPGQDFSLGASSPGQIAILDLSVQPPFFRATGSAGFSGTNGVNFPNKVAIAEGPHLAYALGNSSSNQFVRVFDVSSDPAGIVSYTLVGNIPTTGDVNPIVGSRDMEATENGHWLFTLTGAGTVTLEVFDVSTAPASLPATSVQSIAFPGVGLGAVGLDLSPQGDRLALLVSADVAPALTIFSIASAGMPVLTAPVTVSLAAFPGNYNPADVHFAPDGRLLFVTGPNGAFSVIDTLASPPAVIVPAGTWPAAPGNLWCHGSAVAVQNGVQVGIIGNEGASALYYLVDLNTTSPTFGAVVGSFSTNVAPGSNGNISNHRLHARQNIVVAIDGTGSTVDCEFVDVIDLDQPIPGGYQSWRVKMPSSGILAPLGISCIPRDFDMF